MIQLATDPNASRHNWRPSAAEAKDKAPARRGAAAMRGPSSAGTASVRPPSRKPEAPPNSDSGS